MRVRRISRCELHGARTTADCRDCAEKPLYELAREILDHPSTAFMAAPIRRIVEAVASWPITRVQP